VNCFLVDSGRVGGRVQRRGPPDSVPTPLGKRRFQRRPLMTPCVRRMDHQTKPVAQRQVSSPAYFSCGWPRLLLQEAAASLHGSLVDAELAADQRLRKETKYLRMPTCCPVRHHVCGPPIPPPMQPFGGDEEIGHEHPAIRPPASRLLPRSSEGSTGRDAHLTPGLRLSINRLFPACSARQAKRSDSLRFCHLIRRVRGKCMRCR